MPHALTWGLPGRISSRRSRSRRRRCGCSMTCMSPGVPAAGPMSRPRPAGVPRFRSVDPGPGCGPWRCTWSSSSMSRWSSVEAADRRRDRRCPVSDGFIHSCLRQAAGRPGRGGELRLIRALISAALTAVARGSMRRRCGPGRPGRRSTCMARSPSCTRRSGWAPAAWTPWPTPGSSPASPGSWSLTGTKNYFHPRWEHIAGNHGRAFLTFCGTMRTAPRATPARSGPCRRSGRCAA